MWAWPCSRIRPKNRIRRHPLENKADKPETAAEKVQRLKSMIGGHFKEKQARQEAQAASAARTEQIALLLRTRLQGAQVEKGRLAVSEWMHAEDKKGS